MKASTGREKLVSSSIAALAVDDTHCAHMKKNFNFVEREEKKTYQKSGPPLRLMTRFSFAVVQKGRRVMMSTEKRPERVAMSSLYEDHRKLNFFVGITHSFQL